MLGIACSRCDMNTKPVLEPWQLAIPNSLHYTLQRQAEKRTMIIVWSATDLSYIEELFEADCGVFVSGDFKDRGALET